jgi:hypothetical protein
VSLRDRLFWWWGFWRARPRVYVHNSDLKKADAFATHMRRSVAHHLKTSTQRRHHHRDLLTGYAVAMHTGFVMRQPPARVWTGRPRGSRQGVLVGRPVVYTSARGVRVGETEWL